MPPNLQIRNQLQWESINNVTTPPYRLFFFVKIVQTPDGSIHIIPDDDENSRNSSDEESSNEADSDDQVDNFENTSEDDGYFEDNPSELAERQLYVVP